MALLQLEAEPAELGGEGVVDEEDVHGRYLLPRGGERREPLGEHGKANVLRIARPDQLGRRVAQGAVLVQVAQNRKRLAQSASGSATSASSPVWPWLMTSR